MASPAVETEDSDTTLAHLAAGLKEENWEIRKQESIGSERSASCLMLSEIWLTAPPEPYASDQLGGGLGAFLWLVVSAQLMSQMESCPLLS